RATLRSAIRAGGHHVREPEDAAGHRRKTARHRPRHARKRTTRRHAGSDDRVAADHGRIRPAPRRIGGRILMDAQAMKIAAARAALGEVRSGMTLGLGTGSTAAEFVRLLGEALASRQLSGLRCTCTSNETEEQARSVGIAISNVADIAPPD